MNIVEHLMRGRAIIADGSAWTQGAMARDMSGDSIYDLQSICTHGMTFCAIGAMVKAEGRVHWKENASRLFLPAEQLLNKIAREFYGMPMASVNDQLGHTAVLNIFDEAIERTLDEEFDALEIEELAAV